MQRTLREKISFSGVGLHSGHQSIITFIPADKDAGIRFRRTDLPDKPEILSVADNFTELPVMCTCIQHSKASVKVIEHILAPLNAFGIDNLIIEMDSEEPPFEDGSSAYVVDMIETAGIREQDAPDRTLKLDHPVIFRNGDVELTAYPSETFRVTFFAFYDHPLIGAQSFTLEVNPIEFKEKVARARTFCFQHDVDQMLGAKLLKGASENSALVYGDKNLINGSLIYEDEPVRHKTLDLIGDLALLGRPLKAHVTAWRSGHQAHARFVKKIRKENGL